MLTVENITVEAAGKIVVRDVSLTIEPGKLVAVMGPNGSGKSSLFLAVMGHPSYKIVSGRVLLDGEDVTAKPPHEKALKGLFYAFQHPVEIPGVTLEALIRSALNKQRGVKPISEPIPGLSQRLETEAVLVGLTREHLTRDLNVGFSGGEKKRSEILQAKLLRPRIIVLDEPDSGLDIDGVKMVADYVNDLRNQGVGVAVISHNPRIFEYATPDAVYVINKGSLAHRGGPEIIEKIQREGFRWLGVE